VLGVGKQTAATISLPYFAAAPLKMKGQNDFDIRVDHRGVVAERSEANNRRNLRVGPPKHCVF